jgi:hypothetical protein
MGKRLVAGLISSSLALLLLYGVSERIYHGIYHSWKFSTFPEVTMSFGSEMTIITYVFSFIIIFSNDYLRSKESSRGLRSIFLISNCLMIGSLIVLSLLLVSPIGELR